MRLKYLDLENACLHRKFHVDFADGLIGFFGPQGSGKSTAINLAYAALTNDFSRIQGGQAGAICQQAESHETSKIELCVEHGGLEFKITRILHPKVKHKLEITGYPTLTKANEIATELEKLMGGNRHMLDNYVFVEQWALRNLFNLTEGDRAKTLSQLCNTQKAELCWDMVGKQGDRDRPLAMQVVDNSDDLRRQIIRLESTVTELTCGLQGLVADLYSEVELEAFKTRVLQYHTNRTLQLELTRQQALEPGLKQGAVKAVAEHKEWTAKLVAATVAEEIANQEERRLGELAASAQQLQRDFVEFTRKAQLLSDARRKLMELKQPIRTEPEELAVLETRLTALQLELQPHRAIVSALGKLQGTACPLCKQSLKDPAAQVEAAKKVIAAKQPEEQLLEQRRSMRNREDVAELNWATALKSQQLRINELQTDKAACRVQEAPDVTIVTQWEAAQVTLQQAKQGIATAQARVNKLMQDKAWAITQHKSCKGKIETCEAALLEHPVTEAEFQQAEKEIRDNAQVQLSAMQTETQLLASQQQLQEKQEELAKLRAVQARTVKVTQWLGYLDQVRSVLHRNALPKIVHEAALARMEKGINELLAEFESPWYVTTSPKDLSYIAHFRNGTTMPMQGLSGGQQVITALALRWTLNSVFAGQIGMLCLDEPTAGLDARHVDLLESVLAKLGEIARSRGFQVLIITHEHRLEGVFDQVIELEKAVS